MPSLAIANAIEVKIKIGLSIKKQQNAAIKSNPDLMSNLYIIIEKSEIELITLIFWFSLITLHTPLIGLPKLQLVRT